MRFQLNEILPVIHLRFDTSGKLHCTFRPYYPWSGHTVTKIQFDHLTVTEHHRVCDSYAAENSEPNCDGFVLKSGDNVWHNQYPTASYGQTSDAADRMFIRRIDPDTCLTQWLEENPNTAVTVRSLSDYLTEVKRGIYQRQQAQISEKTTLLDREHTKQLQDHLDAVVQSYEEEFGKKIVFSKLMFGKEILEVGEEVREESQWLEGWWNVEFTN